MVAASKPSNGGDWMVEALEAIIIGPLWTVPNSLWRVACKILGRAALRLSFVPLAVGAIWWGAVEIGAFGAGRSGVDVVIEYGQKWIAFVGSFAEGYGSSGIEWAGATLVAFAVGYVVTATAISGMLLGPVHVLVSRRQAKPEPQSHGSARWGTPADAKAKQNLVKKGGQPGGVMLGRFARGVGSGYDPRFRINAHVLTCAPTGAGKGVGCVIPNLLDYPGSVFCLDVKGENFAVTGKARAQSQPVFVIDPFGTTGAQTASVNWLDFIDPSSEECVADAAEIADTLVVRGDNLDPHWDDSAASLLQGLLLHAATIAGPERHVGAVRDILTLPETELVERLTKLSKSQAAAGVIAKAANMFLAKEKKERSGVLSTAQRHTAFLDDPRIVRTLRRSELDLSTLKHKPQTVYLVIPPDKLGAYNRFCRATIGLALGAMFKKPERPEHNVLFLLDEFAQLGSFAAAERGISIVRGFGGQLWLFVQDLSQLKGLYRQWGTFLSNAVLQVFGTQDHDTAKYVSDALGAGTIKVDSESRSVSRRGAETSANKSESHHHHGRALLTADEVRRLGNEDVIVLQGGSPPFRLRRLDYRVDGEFRGRYGGNPMYGSQLPHALKAK
ncbi:type IV secretory system conjugative DNA transfer family protein [Myxococcota bacterium]